MRYTADDEGRETHSQPQSRFSERSDAVMSEFCSRLSWPSGAAASCATGQTLCACPQLRAKQLSPGTRAFKLNRERNNTTFSVANLGATNSAGNGKLVVSLRGSFVLSSGSALAAAVLG